VGGGSLFPSFCFFVGGGWACIWERGEGVVKVVGCGERGEGTVSGMVEGIDGKGAGGTT
jgi:hypothetical protein